MSSAARVLDGFFFAEKSPVDRHTTQVNASIQLENLSSLNYAHNRRLRWLALGALLAMVIGMLYVIWRLAGPAASQPSQAVTAVGGAGPCVPSITYR